MGEGIETLGNRFPQDHRPFSYKLLQLVLVVWLNSDLYNDHLLSMSMGIYITVPIIFLCENQPFLYSPIPQGCFNLHHLVCVESQVKKLSKDSGKVTQAWSPQLKFNSHKFCQQVWGITLDIY